MNVKFNLITEGLKTVWLVLLRVLHQPKISALTVQFQLHGVEITFISLKNQGRTLKLKY